MREGQGRRQGGGGPRIVHRREVLLIERGTSL